MPSSSEDQARFMAKCVTAINRCWLWTACIQTYRNRRTVHKRGRFRLESRTISASRASWLLFRGKIPKGKQVLHTCDNSLCVNPDHLYLGTFGDNARDRVKDGKAKNQNVYKTQCPKGHPLDYQRPDRPSRGCKTCRRDRAMERYYAKC